MPVVLVSLVVVVLFEMVQLLIPYRAFNINDMLASGVGALLGLVPAWLLWRRYSYQRRFPESGS